MGSDLAVLWAVSNIDYFFAHSSKACKTRVAGDSLQAHMTECSRGRRRRQSEATPKRVYERPHSELL